MLSHTSQQDLTEPSLRLDLSGIGTDVAVGQTISRYKLVEPLGEGGCGMVYVAEQVEPVRRRVALKVIKLGMDTRQVVARFEAERQALALMDHPNIAKVLDAGATDSGRPYFVMELVSGSRITEFCDSHAFTLRQRLELFVQVCRAIQHAHQKGIIHRDIKPSNILVALDRAEANPIPKVIDFGIAKATEGRLTDSTVITHLHQFIGTPAYMSPEQADLATVDIDTRSDIYSLGVLLYELLTGRPPFDAAQLLSGGFDQMRKTIREREPVTPSASLAALSESDRADVAAKRSTTPSKLVHSLHGDLDWIVIKCLEKERTRRYETANALGADITRYLTNEPVVARPPSATYRIQKAIQRNKLAFTAGIAVVAALVLGLGIATYQYFDATAERDRADEARIEAQNQRRIAQASAQAAELEKENTRKALARANTALAEAAYREHDGESMKALLGSVPPELRSSTWDYLHARADTSIATFDGFFIGVAADPTRPGVFALARIGEGVDLVDGRSGTVLKKFPAIPSQEGDYARGIAISPDGKRLALGTLSKQVIAMYDIASGELLTHWEAGGSDSLAFSPDGRLLMQVVAFSPETRMYEAATGRPLWQIDASQSAIFGPQTNTVIADHHGKLVLLDATNGSILRDVSPIEGDFRSLALPKGSDLLLTAGLDGVIRAIHLETGQEQYRLVIPKLSGNLLGVTPDGGRFVSLSQLEGEKLVISLHDAAEGTRLESIPAGTGKFEGLCIHPTSGELLLSGRQTRAWSLRLPDARWSFPSSPGAGFLNGDDTSCLGFSDSREGTQYRLMAGTNPPVPEWISTNFPVSVIAVSGDGRVAIEAQEGTLNSHVRVLKPSGDGWVVSKTLSPKFSLNFLRLNHDGSRLLTFVPGYFNQQFDTGSGETLPSLYTVSIAEIYDARWLSKTDVLGIVTAREHRGHPDSEERIVLWDAGTGRILKQVRSHDLLNAIAVQPQGTQFAEAGIDKMIRIRDATTLEIRSEFRAHDAGITALAWHPSRPILASASADFSLKLWDLSTGKCLQELRPPIKVVTSLAFSPGGTRLLTTGPDLSRIWEPECLQSRSENAHPAPGGTGARPGE